MIDEKATVKNVDDLLKEYRRINRIADGTNDIVTPYLVSSDEKEVDASSVIRNIHEALETLSSEELKNILLKRYIENDSMFDYELFQRMNISNSTFYRRLKKAQVEFAEAFSGWNLLVYNNKK